MIKTKADGHSEANTPLTHIWSIYLFDSVVFLPPSVIIWKRSWWPLLLITFWRSGATVALSTAAAEAQPTVRGFDVRAARPPPPRCRLKFLRDRLFTISSGFIGERVSDTSAAARLFSVAGRHETHRRELDDITEVTSPPTATRTQKPPRVATPQRQARNPKATSRLPNAPTTRCFDCRTLICTIFSAAGSSQWI